MDLHEELVGPLSLVKALGHSFLQQIYLRQLLLYPREEVEDYLVGLL